RPADRLVGQSVEGRRRTDQFVEAGEGGVCVLDLVELEADEAPLLVNDADGDPLELDGTASCVGPAPLKEADASRGRDAKDCGRAYRQVRREVDEAPEPRDEAFAVERPYGAHPAAVDELEVVGLQRREPVPVPCVVGGEGARRPEPARRLSSFAEHKAPVELVEGGVEIAGIEAGDSEPATVGRT